MKYSRRDFSFLKSSWTLRNLHGKTVKSNSETDLFNLICNGSSSIFSFLDKKEYAQAANKIPYILTLLLDELFNIDYELQREFYQQQKNRMKAWENWNDLKISDKLEKIPWLDKYFERKNIQNLFNAGKNSSHNTDEQNIVAVTGLLEFIGGLYNIYEAGASNEAPVPVKGPSRTNLKSNSHKEKSPYYQNNSYIFPKSSVYKSKEFKKHAQKNVPIYQNANLGTVYEYLKNIWHLYSKQKYEFALNPIRKITEGLLKRALLQKKIITPYNAGKYKLSECIDLFEKTINDQVEIINIETDLTYLRKMGNLGSHSGINNNNITQSTIDKILNSLTDIMRFTSDKYGGDFTQIYNFNKKLDKRNKSKEKIIYKTIVRQAQQSTNLVPHRSKTVYQTARRERIRKAKSKKNRLNKWICLAIIAAVILIAANRLINHHEQENSLASEHASRIIHKTHHKKPKASSLKKASQSSSSKKSQSSSSSSSSNDASKPKVSKWVGLYKGENDEDDDNETQTLKINEDGSVVFVTSDDDNGVGRATGYWINKGSISSKIYLTHFDNMDYYKKDDMPLTITMSASKQKLYVKAHDDDVDNPDEYTRWEERQHYNLTNSKWVGTYSGTDSGDDKVTIKINSDGSATYTQDDDDNGVGKAAGYWINGNNKINLYLTHFDNMDGVDEGDMPLIITMSGNQKRISVDSNSFDWTVDHYHRK